MDGFIIVLEGAWFLHAPKDNPGMWSEDELMRQCKLSHAKDTLLLRPLEEFLAEQEQKKC